MRWKRLPSALYEMAAVTLLDNSFGFGGEVQLVGEVSTKERPASRAMICSRHSKKVAALHMTIPLTRLILVVPIIMRAQRRMFCGPECS